MSSDVALAALEGLAAAMSPEEWERLASAALEDIDRNPIGFAAALAAGHHQTVAMALIIIANIEIAGLREEVAALRAEAGPVEW